IEAVPEPEAEPVRTARVAPGAPLVQIGAFDSDGIAQSEWSRISGRFGALFANKAPVVQKHQANGRTFYRLRIAGFESREDARRFCAALIEAGTDCIPAAAK
nr:SPOR domain-containing protein [Paracoccus sp. (in: a-proteobacteria)]